MQIMHRYAVVLTLFGVLILCPISVAAQGKSDYPSWLMTLQKQTSRQWGEHVSGVKRRLKTNEPVIALTFDACGGPNGSQFDAALIDELQRKQIPATLFLNRRWIMEQPLVFRWLANNPLFEIENHGNEHRPLSSNGRSIYQIKGTANLQAAYAEVEDNDRLITQLTGRSPKFFRSGTAYYDDLAVKMVERRGDQVVNFDIRGDAGATYTKEQVKQALLSAKPGSIILLHMNQPQSETAEGVREAIPLLQKKGFRFVQLEDYPLSE